MRLRTFHWLVAACVSLLLGAACSAPPAAAPPSATASKFQVTATFKDVMDSMVDPSADYLWESVATIVTKAGTEERRPRTDEDWKKVRRAAVTLIEATNLLVMDGRKVAKPGEKSENPGIELSPEAIRRVMDDDPATLVKLAHALHDAGVQALAAIDAKNADALSDAGEVIDNACENCHLKYWYPPDAEKIEGAGSVRKK
jgi:cytochrome c556